MEETPNVQRSRVNGALASHIFGGARFARTLWLLNLALIASALLFIFLTPTFLLPVERPAAALVVASCLLSLACSSVGALVASRLPRNPVGWIFCVMGLLYSTWRLAGAYADYALLVRPGTPLGELAAWTSAWFWFSIIASGVLLVLLYPDGRLPSPRWRLAVWAAGVGAVLITLGTAFRSGPLLTSYYVSNPYGVGDAIGGTLPTGSLVEASTIIGGALLCTSCLAAIAALAQRLRLASGRSRRHLEWLAYAAVPALLGSATVLLHWSIERFGLLFLGRTLSPVPYAAENLGWFVSADQAAGTIIGLRLVEDLGFLSACALLLTPLCALVAIRRYGLYTMGFTRPAVPRWLQASLGGAIAGVLPLVFVYMAVFLYVIFYPLVGHGQLGQVQLARVVAFVSGSGALAVFLAATFLMSLLVARKARDRAVVLGTLVGLTAAFVDQTIASVVDPTLTAVGVFGYISLGLAAGYVGALAGRSTLSGGVYRVSRQIAKAKDASAVAAAIGENLGDAGIEGVALWRRDNPENLIDSADAGEGPRGQDQRILLWGSWRANGQQDWPPGLGPGEEGAALLAAPGERSWAAVQRRALVPDDQRSGENSNIHSALLVPLVVPEEAWNGLLMVTFRKRLRFAGRSARAYLTVASQAAVVLENLRLIEEARRAGHRGGIIIERQRLAREIHDTLAQGFTGIITNLSAAELTTESTAMDATSARYVDDAKRIAREGLAEARRLVWALRPESLERYPLPVALSNLVQDWSERRGIEARAATKGTPRELLPEAEVALLRAAQESLTNVHKHARASKVSVTLTYMDDRVIIDVLDDGDGFDPAAITPAGAPAVVPQAEHGYGLTAMRERVEQLGGRLGIESTPGEGTAIVVELRDIEKSRVREEAR